MGLDASWRREAAKLFPNGSNILDVGTGTGVMAQELLSQGHQVTGIDFSEPMIRAARSKIGSSTKARFIIGEASRLPFESKTFDGITSSFVLRNLQKGKVLIPSLREFARVVKPGGLMVHVELTPPPKGTLLWGYEMYMKTVLPSVGWLMFRNRWPRNYLYQSIKEFPLPRTLCQWFRWMGFEKVAHYPLSKGIASIFVGVRCST
jgi:demethylmenaquinone methyltransferase/2-methoxy-6-polyprenyl-1,4-benzoquinol methylase